jgi:predicted nucleic acid-binding protein
MPFVVDASVALSWYLDDEGDPYVDEVLDLMREDRAVVPAIWPLEIANALLAAERRGRLTPTDVTRIAELLLAYPIDVDDAQPSQTLGPVRDLARARNLSSYDAAYLDVAMREGLPLATLDSGLRRAAVALGVPLAG